LRSDVGWRSFQLPSKDVEKKKEEKRREKKILEKGVAAGETPSERKRIKGQLTCRFAH